MTQIQEDRGQKLVERREEKKEERDAKQEARDAEEAAKQEQKELDALPNCWKCGKKLDSRPYGDKKQAVVEMASDHASKFGCDWPAKNVDEVWDASSKTLGERAARAKVLSERNKPEHPIAGAGAIAGRDKPEHPIAGAGAIGDKPGDKPGVEPLKK